MFIQQYPNPSRPAGSAAQDMNTHTPRATRERSTSSSERKDHYTKRSSIFSKRPKSILTNSSHDSSTRSHASISSASDVSWRSLTSDASAMPAESETTKGRFLFGRGRKGKTSATRSSRASSPVDADDESDSRTRGFDRPRGIPGKGVRISAPFAFQHVGQMEEQPATIGEETTEAFENFRTLRKGHRHAIIATSPDQEEHETNAGPRQRRPPPLRPRRPDDLWQSHPGSAPLPFAQQRLPSAHSMDNLHQQMSAASTGYRGIPLDRRSPPRSASGLVHTFNYGPESVVRTETEVHSIDSPDDYESLVPLYDAQPPGWIETSVPLLHTVSPIDNLSDYVRTPGFSQPLEQVPEEPEGTFSNGQSKDLPRRSSLRHAKSSPAVANRYKLSVDPFSAEEPPLPPLARRLERTLSQGSDTLGDPLQSLWRESKSCIEPNKPMKLGQVQRKESTWEDDIDYCYEHNAEADCEYNWQDISHYDDNDSDDSQSWNGQQSSYGSSRQPKREQSQSMAESANHEGFPHPNASGRVPSNSSVPELDYRYSHSASTASLSIATPRDGSIYRASDALPPFDVMQMHASKDSPIAQHASSELQPASKHLYDEIMIARNVDSATPEIPSHFDDRPQTILYSGPASVDRYLGALPTPPPSGTHAPLMPESAFESNTRHNTSAPRLDIDAARMVPLPRSPAPSDMDNDEVPQLVPRSYIGVQNAAKLRLFDAQTRLQSLPPTSMPRNMSSESLNTGIQYTQLPTPPKTPSSAEMANVRSFLATPSPHLPPMPSPVSQTPRGLSPIHMSASPTHLPPLEQSRSAPSRSNYGPNPRHRAESAAARIGVLPSPSTSFIEEPGTPDSASSAPIGMSPGRMGYSLFPSRKPPMPLDSRPPLHGPSMSTPTLPKSAPMTTSEPPTRPVSRATSQASSHVSSHASTRATSRSESRSARSKASKKPNQYQERYPLGI